MPMEFAQPLMPGRLVRRYKRFLADVQLDDGAIVTAHCPNPGSMLSVNLPGGRVWLSASDNPQRKLAYTWELVEAAETLVGINTGLANRIVADGIAAGSIRELAGYPSLRREVPYGRRSRIDLLLEAEDRPPCLVEVKNVTMRRDPAGCGPCEFPDAVTARGAKHLHELAEAVRQGRRAVMFYLMQRGDSGRLSIAADIDPAYGAAFRQAVAAGVEVLCYRCDVGVLGVRLAGPGEIIVPPSAMT
jgi:sugar fermentation stimulation protein A